MTEINIDIAVSSANGKDIRLGDIRAWMDMVDKFNLPNDYPVYECSLYLMLPIPEQNISRIECMECSPKQHNHDVIITTHECVNPYTTIAQAYDQAL